MELKTRGRVPNHVVNELFIRVRVLLKELGITDIDYKIMKQAVLMTQARMSQENFVGHRLGIAYSGYSLDIHYYVNNCSDRHWTSVYNQVLPQLQKELADD